MIDFTQALNAAAGVILVIALIIVAAVMTHKYAPHVPAEIAQAPVCIGNGSQLSCE